MHYEKIVKGGSFGRASYLSWTSGVLKNRLSPMVTLGFALNCELPLWFAKEPIWVKIRRPRASATAECVDEFEANVFARLVS